MCICKTTKATQHLIGKTCYCCYLQVTTLHQKAKTYIETNLEQHGLHFLLTLWLRLSLRVDDDVDDNADEKPDWLFSAISLSNAFCTSSLSSMNRAFFVLCSSSVPFSRTKTSSISSSRYLSSTSEQFGKKRLPFSTAHNLIGGF